MTSSATAASLPGGNTVLVEIVDRVAWVTMNRPEKRNAINPTLSFEMLDVFEALDSDERCGALVLTGAGEAYSSGMDLREYFRATDKLSYDERLKVMRKSALAQWKRLQFYGKPTIAMVNGWCFGGAFNSMIACDLAIAAEDATFGLVGNQLGHHSRRHRDQGGGLRHGPARYHVLHHDRRDLRRPQGGQRWVSSTRPCRAPSCARGCKNLPRP